MIGIVMVKWMSESDLAKKQGRTIRRPQGFGPVVKLVERPSGSWWYWPMCWVVPSLCEWVQLALMLQEESMAWVVAKYESDSVLDSVGTGRRMLTTWRTKQTVTVQDGKQRQQLGLCD